MRDMYFMKNFQHCTILECLASFLWPRAALRIPVALKKIWPELFSLRVIKARLASSASRSDSATSVWRPRWREETPAAWIYPLAISWNSSHPVLLMLTLPFLSGFKEA